MLCLKKFDQLWLSILKKRNTSVHIYNEDEVDEMIVLIRDSFIPDFIVLKDTLVKKLEEAESDWRAEEKYYR